jgi:hypothetical protein
MPLSWNEIKDRALRFSREWALESSEDAEAKSNPPCTCVGFQPLAAD